MSARDKALLIQNAIEKRFGIPISFDDATTLRKAEMTLHRWAELECGDARGCIERDEKTGIPYYHRYSHSYLDPHDPRAVTRIPDREAGALRRIERVCRKWGLDWYHQTDPRGCSLYVGHDLTDRNYTNGLAIC